MKLIFSILVFMLPVGFFAQGNGYGLDLNKRSIKKYNKAIEYIRKKESIKAIDLLEELKSDHPKFYEARKRLARQYTKLGRKRDAINEYEYILSGIDPIEPTLLLELVQILEDESEYVKAISHLEKAQASFTMDPELRTLIQRRIAELEFRMKSYQNPLEINIEKLGPQINSDHSEFLAAINAEGDQMIFSRRVDSDKNSSFKYSVHDDLYYSDIDSLGNYSEALPIEELNTIGNEATHCFSQDGNILIFTACDRYPRQNGCDLFISFRRKGLWSPPRNMGEKINTRFWEAQPSLSHDNKTLYFSSTRKGGFGKSDIWKVELGKNGWSDPVNLGPEINTSESDESPFIHADNKTLYFRSKGHIGHGDFDLFISKRNEDDWSTPINMGFPINSSKDDGALFVDFKGINAYYTSNKDNENNNFDIYRFDLPDEFKPEKMAYVKLKVLDKESKLPLVCTIKFLDHNQESINQRLQTDGQGEALIFLGTGEYLVSVKKEDYIFYSQNMNIRDHRVINDNYEFLIELEKVPEDKEERISVLNNIFFESGSSILLAKSDPELKDLLQLMQENPKIHITIIGHTDNIGSQEDNLKLSEQRAGSVYNALIALGADPDRLSYEGRGESEAIRSNDTEEGRSANRRTEFKISYLEND